MRISKRGNSLVLRLPAAVVKALGLKAGDDVDVRVVGERGIELRISPGRRGSLARLRKYRGRLPADFRFDRPAANKRR